MLSLNVVMICLNEGTHKEESGKRMVTEMVTAHF